MLIVNQSLNKSFECEILNQFTTSPRARTREFALLKSIFSVKLSNIGVPLLRFVNQDKRAIKRLNTYGLSPFYTKAMFNNTDKLFVQ